MTEAIDAFLQSRQDGLSQRTLEFYKGYLARTIHILGLAPSHKAIDDFLKSLPCSPGGKHAYFRTLRVFFRWLHSPYSGLSPKDKENPMSWIQPPRVPKRILPSLTKEQVELLLNTADNPRDKAIIALFTESGLRLSELTNIAPNDIDWDRHTLHVIGKGNKEGLAPFGKLSECYLRAWLTQYEPKGSTIWGIGSWGVVLMLRSLNVKTGLPCNPHTFRRTFACLLRKAGVDCLTIKDLGRWESLEMVQRYTRSVTFEDSLKHYKAPLG